MRVAVVGAGISGLSTAAYLGKAGLEVHVFEKNGGPGGRAGQLQTGNGYLFDMGPSWYWMPEIFDRFFADFGYDVQNLYTLKLLDPSFEIVFRNGYSLKVPSEINDLVDVFEKIEPGSGGKLRRFLRGEKGKYDTILDNLDKIPGLSFFELVKPDFGLLALRSKLFLSHRRHIRRFFSDQRLQLLMEFPVLFLGQPARKVPALYSFMSYAAIMKGTWYPYGGFGKVVEALMKVAEDNGAHFYFNSPVEEIILSGKKVNGINVSGNLISFDAVVCAADYHFAEQYLLPEWARNYDERYWQKKKFAPSCLIFFIGLSKKIGRVEHHTLFFDEDAEQYSKELYEDASWPSRPLFYVSCPSRSDPTVAPYGHENLFFLMPISPGLADDELTRETYFLKMMERFEKHIGERVSSFVDFKLSYCVTDFSTDYNAYNGNAYGLANTLRQTAFMRPSMRNRKIRNLFYTGQLTVPGPGVPPTLISGKMAAGLVLKELKLKQHESAL